MKNLDWQHIALIALALAGGIACVWRPAVAQYVGPLVSVLVPLALGKAPPGGSDGS
jgi:hypothetical protein